MKSVSTSVEAQLDRLLQLLKEGPRTTIELRQHAIMMPAARVYQLRHQLNYNIETELVSQYDTEGVLHSRCARYSLMQSAER